MKVLLVSEPGIDGVFRYVEGLCRFLFRRGIAVHLGYSDRRAGRDLALLAGEVAARGGRTLNLRVGNRPGPADAVAFLSLLALARRLRPDVIHSHSAKAGALARMLRLAGVKAAQVYQPHAYVGLRPERGRLSGLYDAIESALGRNAETIACSPGERAYAVGRLGLPPSRVRTICNGIDTAAFPPPAAGEKRRLRAEFGLPEGAAILGCLGRSCYQKDPLTLYRALAAAGRPMVLFHVGEGELDPLLEAEAKRIGVAGRIIRRSRLYPSAPFYRAVDGFILPSRYEGLSLAALEAMSADLPLILSRAPGNLDVLAQPLSHAWSAAPGDVAGLAGAIRAWHDDLGRGRPSNHRRIAQAEFEAERQYEAVLACYRQLLGASEHALGHGDDVARLDRGVRLG